MLLKAWMERCCVALVSEWRCRQASLGRAADVLAAGSLTPMIAAISVETGAIMHTTATASAREEEEEGEDVAAGLALVLGPALALALMAVDTALAPAVAVTAGAAAALPPIPGTEADLAPPRVPNPGLQPEVVLGLALAQHLEGALSLAPALAPSHLAKGTVVPGRQALPEAPRQQMTKKLFSACIQTLSPKLYLLIQPSLQLVLLH